MGRKKIAPTYQMNLFNDPDLKRLEHDDMVEWAQELVRSHPDRFDRFLERVELDPYFRGLWLKTGEGEKRPWKPEMYTGRMEGSDARDFLEPICEDKAASPPPPPPIVGEKVTWEWPLRSSLHSTREVGFVDLKVVFKRQRPFGYGLVHARDVSPELDNEVGSNYRPKLVPRQGTGLLGEAALRLYRVSGTLGVRDGKLVVVKISDGSYGAEKREEVEGWIEENKAALVDVIGDGAAIDQKYHYTVTKSGWSFLDHFSPVYVEVKTEVPSKGELIRQLRFYERRGATPLVVVAAPDESLAELLKEQGFGFIPYEPKMETNPQSTSHNGA